MTGLRLDRREVIAGLGAFTAYSGSPTIAQAPPDGSDPASLRLLSNLFTRVGGLVRLGDHGPYIFVIDTGAGATAVADTVARALLLAPRAPVRVHGVTAAEVMPSVRIERLSLGGRQFQDLRCPVLPRERMGADGLLGLDVLARFRLAFDTRRRSVTLGERGLSVAINTYPTLGRRVALDALKTGRGRFGQLLMTEIFIDGQRAVGFIDSGAQYSIGSPALREGVRTRRPDIHQSPRSLTLYGVTGQSVSADLLAVRDLRLGRYRLGETPMLFSDLHCFHALGLAGQPALLVGADLLGRFREIVMDFPASAISLRGLQRPSSTGLEALFV